MLERLRGNDISGAAGAKQAVDGMRALLGTKHGFGVEMEDIARGLRELDIPVVESSTSAATLEHIRNGKTALVTGDGFNYDTWYSDFESLGQIERPGGHVAVISGTDGPWLILNDPASTRGPFGITEDEFKAFVMHPSVPPELGSLPSFLVG
jgi:hypothetical protein